MSHPSAAHLGDQAKLALQESMMVQNISRGKHALQMHFTKHLQNCGCERSCVAQLLFTSHWPLDAPWLRTNFGCAGQVDAVAPPSFSSQSLDIMSSQGFNGVVRNYSRLSILGVERTHTRCTKACGLSATRASIRVTERDSPELVTSTRHQSNSRL